MKQVKLFSLLILVMLFVCTGGCKRQIKPVFDNMTDVRDGQTYQTVTLGDQTWFAQNLNYETDNSWCYQDAPANCDIYGRLYDWEAAKEACPAGWHLGSDGEWATLIKTLDRKADPNNFIESKIAGGMMKTTGTIEDGTGLWNSPNTGATNSSGFSAKPSGTRSESGSYQMMGYHIMFWTSTEYDGNHAWTLMVDNGQSGIFRDNLAVTKASGLAVRCIQQ